MRTVAGVVALSAALLVPAGAEAVPATVHGLTCGMESSGDDPTMEGATQFGEVKGGPVQAISAASLTVRCDIQVGASTHSGGDDETVTGSGLVVAVASGPVVYAFFSGVPVYLCTRWTVNGVNYYHDAESGLFSTSSAVACVQAISQEAGPTTTYAVDQEYASR